MSIVPPKDIKGILFDLDGTLLNIRMEAYIDAYIDGLARCFEDLADRMVFAEVLISSAYALLSNRDGEQTNEQFFLSLVASQLGIGREQMLERLQRFYRDGLTSLAELIRPFPQSRAIMQSCFDKNLKVALATNPVFPGPVVEARLRSAGLDDFPYHHISSYENSHYCKPNPRFFLDILAKLELDPSQAVMVGNDTHYDLPSPRTGIASFLVDTCLIDHGGLDRNATWRGDHNDLLQFVRRLPERRND